MGREDAVSSLLGNRSLFRTSAYVDGEWVEATSGETIDVWNPADGKRIATVPSLGPQDVRRAIDAAAHAFKHWRALRAKDRSELLKKWYELIRENTRDLALLMTLEQGKPLAEATGEIAYAASFVQWFAEEAKRTYGDVVPTHQLDTRVIVLQEPIGVCGAITPWNYPSAMVTRKVAPALAAGCVMVLKPSPETPLSALALARLAEMAGVPRGVFNVVTGIPAVVGGELAAHPTVRMLSLTGSTEVGKLLMAQCAGTLKKLSFELGGNAPFIVFDDCDLDAAVAGALVSKYRNSGQTCVCANRLLIHKGVQEVFARKLCAAIEKQLKVGDGRAEGTTQGPLIHGRATQRMEGLIADAVAKGARVLSGGGRAPGEGHLFQPTVLANVNRQMRVFQEEIFGPLAPLIEFETEEEAIQLANDTEMGLAAYFYTRDLARSWRVAEALDYGMVGINTGILSTETAPFGGRKLSGVGREGSRFGIEEYLVTKYLCMAGIHQAPEHGA
jgi:succinate-semialdehyde dehydrogenase / glutarate-semialdehyde dehydrogenase